MCGLPALGLRAGTDPLDFEVFAKARFPRGLDQDFSYFGFAVALRADLGTHLLLSGYNKTSWSDGQIIRVCVVSDDYSENRLRTSGPLLYYYCAIFRLQFDWQVQMEIGLLVETPL